MWSYLQITFQNIFDILKIYLKLGLITVVIYLVTEWYIIQFGIDLNDNQATLVSKTSVNSNNNNNNNGTTTSTLIIVYRLLIDFFIH